MSTRQRKYYSLQKKTFNKKVFFFLPPEVRSNMSKHIYQVEKHRYSGHSSIKINFSAVKVKGVKDLRVSYRLSLALLNIYQPKELFIDICLKYCTNP